MSQVHTSHLPCSGTQQLVLQVSWSSVVCRLWSDSSPCCLTACGKLLSHRPNTLPRSKRRSRSSDCRCGNHSHDPHPASLLAGTHFHLVTDLLLWNMQGDAEEEDENLPVQEVSFDPEKAQCCVVENGQGLTHGSGGKGYGLASTGISSGCYQWKVTCHQLTSSSPVIISISVLLGNSFLFLTP